MATSGTARNDRRRRRGQQPATGAGADESLLLAEASRLEHLLAAAALHQSDELGRERGLFGVLDDADQVVVAGLVRTRDRRWSPPLPRTPWRR